MLRTLIAAGLRQQGAEAGLAACRAAVGSAAWWAAPGGPSAAGTGSSGSSGSSGSPFCQPWGWRGMAHSSRRCSSGAQWEVLRQQVGGSGWLAPSEAALLGCIVGGMHCAA